MGATITSRERVAAWLDEELREEPKLGNIAFSLDSVLGDVEVGVLDALGVPWKDSDGADVGYDRAMAQPFEDALHRAKARCYEAIRQEFMAAAMDGAVSTAKGDPRVQAILDGLQEEVARATERAIRQFAGLPADVRAGLDPQGMILG